MNDTRFVVIAPKDVFETVVLFFCSIPACTGRHVVSRITCDYDLFLSTNASVAKEIVASILIVLHMAVQPPDDFISPKVAILGYDVVSKACAPNYRRALDSSFY